MTKTKKKSLKFAWAKIETHRRGQYIIAERLGKGYFCSWARNKKGKLEANCGFCPGVIKGSPLRTEEDFMAAQRFDNMLKAGPATSATRSKAMHKGYKHLCDSIKGFGKERRNRCEIGLDESSGRTKWLSDQIKEGVKIKKWFEEQCYGPAKLCGNPGLSGTPGGCVYQIKLTEGEVKSLAYIADRYEYASALYDNMYELNEGSGVWCLSESDAWDFHMAVEEEDGWMTLAGGNLAEKLVRLWESIV